MVIQFTLCELENHHFQERSVQYPKGVKGGDSGACMFVLWAPLGARARCTILHCCFGVCVFFFAGEVGGANNVLGWPSYKRYALGLAAMLSTLSCTVPCHTL